MSLPVALVAAFFAAMGVVTLIRPATAWAPFGVTPTTPAARNEVRAVYGGFGIAVAVILVIADGESAGFRDGVMVAVAVACVGMAVGRLVGFVLEPRAARGFPLVFGLVELGLAALAWTAATPLVT